MVGLIVGCFRQFLVNSSMESISIDVEFGGSVIVVVGVVVVVLCSSLSNKSVDDEADNVEKYVRRRFIGIGTVTVF